MRVDATNGGKATRRFAALLVAVWLTGAGCILCCERAGAAAAPAGDEGSVASRHATGASEPDHSCCRAKLPGQPGARRQAVRPADAAQSERTGSRAVAHFPGGGARPQRARSCCENTGQTRDAARKPRVASEEQGASTSEAPAAAARRSFAAPAATRARLPDRGGTYLRTCVFLI